MRSEIQLEPAELRTFLPTGNCRTIGSRLIYTVLIYVEILHIWATIEISINLKRKIKLVKDRN